MSAHDAVTHPSQAFDSISGSTVRLEVGLSIGTFLCLLGIVFVSVYRLHPPNVVPASAPLAEFSADRAMEHLPVMANKPHPVGSEEHARVGEYIRSQLTLLGLSPELQ